MTTPDDPAVAAAKHVTRDFWAHGEVRRLGIDIARAALAPVRERHKPMSLMCLAPSCAQEECDHEDGCPADYPVRVCAHCWDLAQLVSAYYGEDGISECFLWPCDTAHLVYSAEELAQ